MKSQEIFLFFFIFLPLFSVESSRCGLVNRVGSFSALWALGTAEAAVCIHYIRINIHSVFIQKWIILLNI